MIFTPDQKLLALSWKEPFASLMLHGKIETRTWNTNYRGWVLICASQKGYTWDQMKNISGEQIHRISSMLMTGELKCRYSVAIGIGYLSDCRPMKPEDEATCFVKYYPDLFCHVYTNVQAIKPIQWKGSQGWKEVPIEIKKTITNGQTH